MNGRTLGMPLVGHGPEGAPGGLWQSVHGHDSLGPIAAKTAL